ncbi:MAG: hypothetical protein ABSA81_06800 [Candidatus Bathyarchaeia archaeon]
MVAHATGRIARRTDGKYFLYLPKHLVEDSAFPFELESSVPVKVVIDRDGEKLLIMPLKADRTQRRNKR